MRYSEERKKKSKLGFGGLPLQRLPFHEGVGLVKYAFSKGITYYDTAAGYGHSEKIIGEALKDVREKVTLVSKTKVRDPKLIELEVEKSLENLQTDRLDLFQFHNVKDLKDLDNIFNSGLMGEINSLQRRGKIKEIGISSHRIDVLTESIMKRNFNSIMFAFNYVEIEPLEGLIPLCKTFGVDMVIMKPMGGGVLNYPDIAIRWLGCVDANLMIIPGMTSRQEVDKNLAQIRNPRLSKEDYKRILKDRQRFKDAFCHRCEYCMPCPKGINVSLQIQWRGLLEKRDGWKSLDQKKVDLIKKGLDCVQCGICEKRCPYHLPLKRMVLEETRFLLQRAEQLGFKII